MGRLVVDGPVEVFNGHNVELAGVHDLGGLLSELSWGRPRRS
jgi:hypothetical protein